MPVARSCCPLLLIAAAGAACHPRRRPPRRPDDGAPLRCPRPAAVTAAPAGGRAPRPAAPLSEAELFRRKSLDELNAEHPLADAFFDYNQNILREDAKQALQQDAQWLAKWPQTMIRIDGHCDERGTAEYNLALGERRAQVVREYLTGLGVRRRSDPDAQPGKEAPFCRDTGSPAGRRIVAVTSRSRRSESARQMYDTRACDWDYRWRFDVKHFDAISRANFTFWFLACRSLLTLPDGRVRRSHGVHSEIGAVPGAGHLAASRRRNARRWRARCNASFSRGGSVRVVQMTGGDAFPKGVTTLNPRMSSQSDVVPLVWLDARARGDSCAASAWASADRGFASSAIPTRACACSPVRTARICRPSSRPTPRARPRRRPNS